MIPMMVFSMAMQAAKAGSESNSANQLNRMQKGINPMDPTYKVSPYAQQRLGLAQNLLNARMPGATAMERNIYGNQANQMANVERNATSGSQALAMGSAAQGQTNQAFQNLGVQEQQDYYNRLGNQTSALQGMTQEGDKVYQDQLRDYQEKMSLKNAYLGASMQNRTTSWNSLANMGLSGSAMASQLPPDWWKKKQIPNAQADNSFMNMDPAAVGGGVNTGSMMPGAINPNMMSGLFGGMGGQ